MTCKDIMTPDPVSCLSGDSVAIAAEIMKRNDVGPVPVVSDHNEKRLIGIVTDRDLAINVVAERRDPNSTRVDEIMSRYPVSCRENDSTDHALQLMAENQIRRIPITNENGRLLGIVAQADLARHEDEGQVGRVVEEISEPYGSSHWGSHRTDQSRWSESGSLALGALCMGLGAGLMYVMDPTRGSARRSRIQDRGYSLYNQSGQAIQGKAKDLRNRASGLVASTKSTWERAEIPDDKLVARVRSKIGHHVTNSSAIDVISENGNVTLTGPILAEEVRDVLDAVNTIPGVRSVQSRLDVHETPGSNPSLQGMRRTRSSRSSGEWSPNARMLAGVAGGALMLFGMRSKSRTGRAATTIGSGLLTRGFTNREFTSWAGEARRLVGI
jgi:CBS domain-containing protein